MTDYAKHIEVLQHPFRDWPEATRVLANDAAIELMRAAMPKDAEAERQECQRIAEEWLTDQRIAHPESASADALGDLLEEKRAAARAEGYAEAIEASR